tara:strand:+ start:15119 stop:15442 length:324 start_codon:yes stop_codon:yes gene_type:complete
MIEAFLAGMPMWQKLAAYAFLLAGLFIFVKTGCLKIMSRPVIPIGWRIALAIFFPVILLLGLTFGAFVLGLVICVVALAALIGISTGRKPKLPKFGTVRINVIKKEN